MFRVILIGGTSHVGKSTLGRSIADRLGWPLVSTDSLARHPGRPWPVVRPHVAEYYLNLTDETIYEFLVAHHVNMWPGIRDMISASLAGHAAPLVLEGSALRPEFAAELDRAEILAVWLTGSELLIRERIHRESGYLQCSPESRRMIDRFLARSLMDNRRIEEASRHLGLSMMDAEAGDLPRRLEDRLEVASGVGARLGPCDDGAPVASSAAHQERPGMPRQLISSGSAFEEQIGYSRAVVTGDWVFVSGTTGFDYDRMAISDDVVEQTEQCMKNVEAALREAGSTLSEVVRVTYVLPDGNEFERCWPVLRRYFGDVRPAAMMISAGLADPRMKIEIEVTALRGSA